VSRLETGAVLRRRSLNFVLGGAWLLSLCAVVFTTIATRSPLAGTNDRVGPAVIAFTMPAIALAVWRFRHPALIVIVVAATVISCVTAASVLNDTSSTAALGVPTPGMFALGVVLVGLALQAVLK
jgi:hypothetical protein